MDKILEGLAKFFGHLPVSGVEAFLFQALKAVLVLLVTYVGLKLLGRTIDRRLKSSDSNDPADIRMYKKICRFIVWTVGILLALHVAGIKLTSIFTTSGLFAVALGFALKNILENYVSGLILKTDESIKHGDVLTVDGQMVKVKSVGVRDTIVRTKDDCDILIPNSLLVQGKIGNYTHRDSLCRTSTTVGVSYASDLKKVREVLEEVCTHFDGLSTQHEPVVLLTDFGDSSVNYQVFIWTEDPWQIRVLKSKLNEAVWWGLKNAGIEIAFPQLDVHFDPGDESNDLKKGK
jgi:small-conductance mechanosensitive channel